MSRLESPSTPWVLANAAGLAIGGAVAAGLILPAEMSLIDSVPSQPDAAAGLAPVIAASLGLTGAILGGLQWLVLRRWLPASGWWIVATAAGWAAAGAIDGILSGFLGGAVTHVGPGIGPLGFLLSFLGSVAAIGLLPGVLQSFVLRHRVGTLTWSAAHLKGLGAGVLVAFPVMLVVAGVFGWNLPSPPAWAFAGLLAGTVFGIVTWNALDGALAPSPGPRTAPTRPDGATV